MFQAQVLLFNLNFLVGVNITVRRYLVKVPEGYPLEKAGPIFCAGKNTPCYIQHLILNKKCDHGTAIPHICHFIYTGACDKYDHGTAGITMYSPLSHWGCLGGGKRVGIVGIGGLGQMGVRVATKFSMK